MSPHFWRANEKALVTRMYEAGEPLRDIAGATGVSADAIRRAVGRWKLHRPAGHIGVETRQNLAWPRIRAALEKSQGVTVADLCEALGMFRSVVLKAICEHRGELDVVRWNASARKPAAVWALGSGREAMKPIKARRVIRTQSNPFLVAAGAIAVPTHPRGRVISHDMRALALAEE